MDVAADPFDAGPFPWMRRPMPLAPPCERNPWRPALMTIVIGWVPLAVLGALERIALGPSMRESVLLDFAAQGRYLVAAPAFASAGTLVLPQLALVVRQFADSGFIRDDERGRYDALIATTRALLRSRVADVVLLLLAYAWTIGASPLLYPSTMSSWVAPQQGVALLAGPALLLSAPLARLQVWGTFHYGKLASEVGRAFQRRWTPDDRHAGKGALEVPDFSATTDLCATVANVYQINTLVLNLRALAVLVVFTLIPFVPVVFAVMPIEEILQFAMRALQ